MQMALRRACAALALLTLASGCTTLLKQAVTEVRGARAHVESIEVADGPLNAATLRFRPAQADAPQATPATLLGALAAAARQAESDYSRTDGGRQLDIDTRVLYFKSKSVFDAALLLARVQAFDGTRRVLDAFVRTESKSFRASGEDDMARETVKAVAEYLTDPKRDRRERDGNSSAD